MKNYLYIILFSFLLTINTFGNYNTPGTGIKWNLNDLVTNSGGMVTFSGGEYFVNDTIHISLNDTLYIYENAVVKFMTAAYFSVRGTLLIDPPDSVKFTAENITNGYFGVRVDTSNTCVVRNLIFEYAVSFRLFDCSIIIDSSVFRYNNNLTSTTFGNGAIALFRAKPVITNTLFYRNKRAAVQGGANNANAPVMIGNTFLENVTNNLNVPQINMGATGTDTSFVLNNQIIGGFTSSGGIGFLPIGTANAVITGNLIKNNRYGITLNGGSNINSLISYNQIDSNNIQNDPAIGGSGISFSGGSSTSHQNSIVTGNIIRWNLWGITIVGNPVGQAGSRPNLGNILNADTTDDGKNVFWGNDNAMTHLIDLYNNSTDTIFAQNNYWGTEDSAVVELRIFHYPDNNLLGPVYYTPIIIPVELLSFSANVTGNSVSLNWQTATELNNNGFELLRNNKAIAFVPGYGTTTEIKSYSYSDENLQTGKFKYTLVQIDYDGTRTIVKEIEVEIENVPVVFSLNQNYPNPFNPSTKISFSIPEKGNVSLKIFNSLGEEAALILNKEMEAGNHMIEFNAENLPSGIYLYQLSSGNNISTKKMMIIK